MTRIVVDPDALERAARVLDHVADEYHGLARELHAFPSLPGPIGGWVDAERGRVAGGLDAQAGALHSTATRLRQRAQEARMADAADGRDRRGRLPDRLPHWPQRPPPLQPRPAEAAFLEDFLHWLREQVAVTPVPGRFGLGLHSMSSTTSGDRPGWWPAALLGLLILVGALLARSGFVQLSRPQDSSESKPESVPTTVDTSTRCTPQPTFNPDPLRNYKNELNPETLDAARRELRGEVVKLKPDGTPYDHVGKVKRAQAGLKNTIARMRSRLTDTRCSAAQRAEAERIISEASRLLDYSEKFVPPGS